MLPGETEDRFEPTVVFDELPHDEADEGPEARFAVVLVVEGAGKVPSYPGRPMGPTERGGIGGREEEEPFRGSRGRVHERRGGSEGVEVHAVEPPG